MSVIDVVKLLCLIFGIWFTSVNVVKTVYGHQISVGNFIIMSVIDAGFIWLQWMR